MAKMAEVMRGLLFNMLGEEELKVVVIAMAYELCTPSISLY
jgi:hypothetical protein